MIIDSLKANSLSGQIKELAEKFFRRTQKDSFLGDNVTSTGYNCVNVGYSNTTTGPDVQASDDFAFAVGRQNTAGLSGTAIGFGNNVAGVYSGNVYPAFAFGMGNTVTGAGSMAVGQSNTVSAQLAAAIGYGAVVSGSGAFATGNNTVASGANAFAAGNSVSTHNRTGATGVCTTASGTNTFACGLGCVASANQSMAQGQCCTAQAVMSAAFGNGTLASSRAQLVCGQFNVEDTAEVNTAHGGGARKYLFIVGNGTSKTALSNAFTVDWDGNAEASAFVRKGGTASQFLKADGSVDATAYAPKASPTFTGTPKAPTPTAGDSSTQVATTAFVQARAAEVIAAIPKTQYDCTALFGLAANATLSSSSVGFALPDLLESVEQNDADLCVKVTSTFGSTSYNIRVPVQVAKTTSGALALFYDEVSNAGSSSCTRYYICIRYVSSQWKLTDKFSKNI